MKKSHYFILFLLFLTPVYYAQILDSTTQKHLLELSAKYPVGMNRDSSEEKNCKVQLWILVQDKKTFATEYMQKTYSYGAVYWFKNGFSISRQTFLSETK
ncbi:MAG TPA: hypothetical protein VNZ45_14540 [Bacteroidia bacterium]|jgi:hypothetical protein|nr:hypothetical protein [Bacteroidia bacterium]